MYLCFCVACAVNAQGELAALQLQLEELRAKESQVQQQSEELKAADAQAKEQLVAAQQQAEELRQQVAKLTSEAAESEKRVGELTKAVEAAEASRVEVTAKMEAATQQVTKMNDDKKELAVSGCLRSVRAVLPLPSVRVGVWILQLKGMALDSRSYT